MQQWIQSPGNNKRLNLSDYPPGTKKTLSGRRKQRLKESTAYPASAPRPSSKGLPPEELADKRQLLKTKVESLSVHIKSTKSNYTVWKKGSASVEKGQGRQKVQ